MHTVVLTCDLQAPAQPEPETREGGAEVEAASPTPDPTQLRNQFNYSDRAAQVCSRPLILRRPVCLLTSSCTVRVPPKGTGVILPLHRPCLFGGVPILSTAINGRAAECEIVLETAAGAEAGNGLALDHHIAPRVREWTVT